VYSTYVHALVPQVQNNWTALLKTVLPVSTVWCFIYLLYCGRLPCDRKLGVMTCSGRLAFYLNLFFSIFVHWIIKYLQYSIFCFPCCACTICGSLLIGFRLFAPGVTEEGTFRNWLVCPSGWLVLVPGLACWEFIQDVQMQRSDSAS
jgi:hypothetical protein